MKIAKYVWNFLKHVPTETLKLFGKRAISLKTFYFYVLFDWTNDTVYYFQYIISNRFSKSSFYFIAVKCQIWNHEYTIKLAINTSIHIILQKFKQIGNPKRLLSRHMIQGSFMLHLKVHSCRYQNFVIYSSLCKK